MPYIRDLMVTTRNTNRGTANCVGWLRLGGNIILLSSEHSLCAYPFLCTAIHWHGQIRIITNLSQQIFLHVTAAVLCTVVWSKLRKWKPCISMGFDSGRRRDIETRSALRALCCGNPSADTHDYVRSLIVFLPMSLTRLFNKQYNHMWFETPLKPRDPFY